MKKFLAAAAVVAAATGTFVFGAGHADAQQICVTLKIDAELPAPPVTLPAAPPLPINETVCLPPSGGPSLP
jgi:hypothetical protein